MTHLRIRLLRQPGVEGAVETVFASRYGTAPPAFPLSGRCRRKPTDEVEFNLFAVRQTHIKILTASFCYDILTLNLPGYTP